MMISPESYYEMNLKGKTAEQIMSATRERILTSTRGPT